MADQNPSPQDASLDEPQRRALLQAAAGLAIAGAVDDAVAQETKSKPTIAGASTTSNNSATAKPEGKAGDFNFLAGEWCIDHRRLKSPGEWDEFKGEATCWTILGGVASIEELRIPARNFSGMGIRVLDIEKKIWSDFWVNSKFGVLAPPGLTGSFKDGVGTFEADDEDNGKKIRVAGIWDRITPKSCRWRQGVSRDGGKTWEYSWLMDWMKV
jgi:hypothetical protein